MLEIWVQIPVLLDEIGWFLSPTLLVEVSYFHYPSQSKTNNNDCGSNGPKILLGSKLGNERK